MARAQRGVFASSFGAAAVTVGRLGVRRALVTRDDDLAERLGFALRLNLTVLFCLAVAIFRVSTQRVRSPEDIGGSASPSESAAVRQSRAILQNTLEQVVLAIRRIWRSRPFCRQRGRRCSRHWSCCS